MAVTAAPYANFLLKLPKGLMNLADGNVKVALADATYVPDMQNDAALADVDGIVTAATAQTLTGVTFTYNSSSYTVIVAAADAVWTAADFTAHYAVVYHASAGLIGYIDFGENKTYSSEDFTLNFSSGFVQLPAPTSSS